MKNIFFYTLFAFVLFGMQGCVGSNNETYIAYENNNQVVAKENVPLIQEASEDISGIIKGTVTMLSYNGSLSLWEYFVQGIDTSNGKLQSAKFSHKKDVAKKGDLVYVFIESGKLKDFYLLQRANYKVNDTKKSKEVKAKVTTEKRTKNQDSGIGVPASETISLD
jgi:hypothetical protein